MKEKIEEIVIDALVELNEEIESESLKNPTNKTKLYGGDGALDSLALVTLIADLEERIAEEFDKEILLADERAMSQRHSPFRSVDSLARYITQLLEA